MIDELNEYLVELRKVKLALEAVDDRLLDSRINHRSNISLSRKLMLVDCELFDAITSLEKSIDVLEKINTIPLLPAKPAKLEQCPVDECQET